MNTVVRSLLRRAAVGSALVILAGCGGGDSVGPSATAEVGGNWILTWSNMTGTVGGFGTITCDATGLHATITQTGTSLTGQIVGGWTLSCTMAGVPVSETLTGGTISSGTVTGSHIHFHLATEDAEQDGTVQGNRMSGTASWRIDFGAPYGVATLTGRWTGVRE